MVTCLNTACDVESMLGREGGFDLFEKFRRKSAAARLQEEQLYEQVIEELSKDEKRPGLWAKALADCDGSEQKAESLYIRYRVQSIKDEIEIMAGISEEAERQSAIDKKNKPPHSFIYKSFTIKHNFITYWVEGRSFGSAQDAKDFIDRQT